MGSRDWGWTLDQLGEDQFITWAEFEKKEQEGFQVYDGRIQPFSKRVDFWEDFDFFFQWHVDTDKPSTGDLKKNTYPMFYFRRREDAKTSASTPKCFVLEFAGN